MKQAPVKLSWLERAKQVQEFHIEHCRLDKSWRLGDTALSLNRSIGSVSQDLLIARWLKTHENQIRRCRSLKDALEYVREKDLEMRLQL